MALVFDIEKFAIHDGPGIRTVVFLKGCPLHCQWCHNPESHSFEPELFFDATKCTQCRRCATACPQRCHTFENNAHFIDRRQCLHCGKCVQVCPVGALEIVGKQMTVSEVMAEVLADQVFYDHSGGGITISGGEPLAHFDFTRELLTASRQSGLHTCVETSGFAPWEQLEQLLPLVDLWLWDVKAPRELHEQLVGTPNDLILENLQRLDKAGAATILRCPLIPGVNDSDAALLSIAQLANTLNHLQQIELEPYHPLGETKNIKLGKKEFFQAPFVAEATKEHWREFLSARAKARVRL